MKRPVGFVLSLCALLILSGCAADVSRGGRSDFAAALHEADSVYNKMEFNKAYELYLALFDLPEVRQDEAKRLEVLYSMSMVSEMSSRKNDQMQWLAELIELARSTHDDYYLSQGLMLMGKHVYFEGDRSDGVAYVREAVELMAHTDRPGTDHAIHSQLNVLSNLLSGMQEFDSAVEVDERNVKLTFEGTRWGTTPQLQLRNQRTALAKLALHQLKAGEVKRADSSYLRWKAVPLAEGANPRDYFIVDYLRERGRYAEAEAIYEALIAKIRAQSDTLGSMMLFAKSGLAEVEHKSGKYRRACDLYADVLVISDTLQARQARVNAQELSVLYGTQEKERQLHMHKLWLAVLGGAAAVLLVIIVSVLVSLAKIRKKNLFLAQAVDELVSRKSLPEPPGAALPSPPSAAEGAADELASLFVALDNRLESERLYLKPELNRDDLCRLIGVNKNVLGSIIKQYSGAPNSQVYINRKRVQYAVILFQEHPLWTMLSIAEACGMKNTATFNRIFRQTYGITPTEYLKSRKRGGGAEKESDGSEA